MLFWLLKAFGLGASLIIILICLTHGYLKLEEFLTEKYGEDAMKLLWTFLIMSMILGCILLRLVEEL